jgi:hypothetical protein
MIAKISKAFMATYFIGTAGLLILPPPERIHSVTAGA